MSRYGKAVDHNSVGCNSGPTLKAYKEELSNVEIALEDMVQVHMHHLTEYNTLPKAVGELYLRKRRCELDIERMLKNKKGRK